MLSIPFPCCCYFFFLLVSCSAGFITIFKLLISLTKWSYIYFLRPSKNLTQTYGSWALITGSTDGIGKALAFELAITHGLNIILVSRNTAKLKLVLKEIKRLAPNRSVKLVEIDFSSEKDLAAGIERIREVTREVEVGVLINNVGVTYPRAMYFHETAPPVKTPVEEEEGVWRKVVRVNVEGTTWVTKVVLKGMVERGRGAVVNIGSGAGIVAPSHPLYAMYAATKVYVDQFSRSLHTEYKAKGIDVQCQVPLYVATKMVTNLVPTSSSDTIQRQRSTLFTPSPQAYAKAAVRRIGYEPRCTPYWSHSLQWWLAYQLPDFLLDEWRLSIGLNRRRARARANVT